MILTEAHVEQTLDYLQGNAAVLAQSKMEHT